METEQQQLEVELEAGRATLIDESDVQEGSTSSSSGQPTSGGVIAHIMGPTQIGWMKMCNLISVDGPPWYDSITGEELDEKSTNVAIKSELDSLKNMDVKEDVPSSEVPSNTTVIPSRWVLRKKGESVKARVVAQQLKDKQLDDVFASTPSVLSLRLLLYYLLVNPAWSLIFGDVSTAFLHALIPMGTSVYVDPPPNWKRIKPGYIWKLRRALYGLRHSPKWWQDHLRDILTRILKWKCSKSDPNLYFFHNVKGDLIAVMSVHTDDLLIAAMKSFLEYMTKLLNRHFKIKWHGFLQNKWMRHLGREYRFNVLSGVREILVRIPEEYYEETLRMCGMLSCKSARHPGVAKPRNQDQSNKSDDTPLSSENHSLYRAAVGRLMWLLSERPDLAYAVKQLARECSAPTMMSWKSLQQVLKYIQGSKDHVMRLRPDPEITLSGKPPGIAITAHTDADWSVRNTSGGYINVHGVTLITWSRTQAVSALSSCESEFYAIVEGAKETLMVYNLFQELEPRSSCKIKIFTDSTSAQAMCNRKGPGRVKHLSIRMLFHSGSSG